MRHTAALLILTAASLHAQQPPQPAPTGATITGTIYCADTGRPARFAIISLYPADPTAPISGTTSNIIAAATSGQGKTATPMPTTATVDGAYSITDVPPGTYYIGVHLPGYINPVDLFTREDLRSTDPDTHKRILASLTPVTIIGSEAVRLDPRIDRAAAVSGRILYDDGSPASRWQVNALPADPHSKANIVTGGMTPGITDDRGDFRLSGFPAGSYVLQATYQSVFIRGNSSSMQQRAFALSIYSGSAFRFADATPISITAGEEHTGVDIIVPLHSLHTISGYVTAQSDGHAVNSGQVSLNSPDDSHFGLETPIDKSGGFTFNYVPGNTTYTLHANAQDATPYAPGAAPAQTVNGMQMRPATQLHHYAEVKQDIHLGDVDLTNITLTVPDATPAAPSR